MILLEDITAAQGDDLLGCSPDQAAAIVALVRSLHSLTQTDDRPNDIEAWRATPVSREDFESALERAVSRYPGQLGPGVSSLLDDLVDRAHQARRRLSERPRCLLHCDPHLDNILWRDDRSPVLLDWSNARFGPAGVDLAALLVGYSLRDDPALAPGELLDIYAAGDEMERVESEAVLGVTSMVAGLIGWAGEESNAGFHPRKQRLRDDAAVRARHVLDWLDDR